jgi:hypothetical protein
LQAEGKAVPADLQEGDEISRDSLKLLRDFIVNTTPALAAGETTKLYSKEKVTEEFPDRDWSDLQAVMNRLNIDPNKQWYTQQEVDKIRAHFEIATATIEQIGLDAVGGADGKPTRGQLSAAKKTAIALAKERNIKINQNVITAVLRLEIEKAQTFAYLGVKTFWTTFDSTVAQLNEQELNERFGSSVETLNQITDLINNPEKLNQYLVDNGATPSDATKIDNFLTEESATVDGKTFDEETAADFLSTGKSLEEYQEEKGLPKGLTFKDYTKLSTALRARMTA